MQKIKLFLTISALLIMQYSGKLNAQVIFSLGSQSGINSSKVVIPVTVQNFTDIATVQFSVNWDADVVNYMAAEDYAFNSITGTSFGTSSVDAGILRFSWNAVEVESQTLNNGDTLFSIRYNIVGQEGESSLIEITNDPIAIEVTDLNYEEKEVTVNSGLIEIEVTPDTMSPTVPTGLSATVISHRQVDLSWGASSDNVGVSGYEIYRNGAEVASVNATTYSDTGLMAETEYSYQVRAVDSSGNVSALSSAASATTPAQPDTISPTVPTGLSATAISHRQVDLSWGASSDNIGVSGYEIYRNGAEVASVNATTYSDTGLVAETEYSYQVRAVDSSGNVSALSSAVSAITPAKPDTIVPNSPHRSIGYGHIPPPGRFKLGCIQ